jgi:metallo-beta-lactamase family protein
MQNLIANENPTPNSFYVSFFGAARTVTGSLYYLEYYDQNLKPFRFTIDAGMFQVGNRANLYRINSYLGFDPKSLDAIVLTHAHLDHCGRIPYLTKMGFNGPIYSTPATLEIASVVMLDSARMQDEEGNKDKLPEEYKEMDAIQKAAYAEKFKNSSGSESGEENELPQLGQIKEKMADGEGYLKLYSIPDANKAITFFETHPYHEKFKIHEDLEIEYWDAGHILGSAYVVITNTKTGQQVVFSGDLGNIDKPIIEDPETPPKLKNITHVFTETTYGDKQHGKKEPKAKLLEACKETLELKQKVFIPAFSVERAQEIIYFLNELMEEGSLPYVPVFLDSPMAQAVVDICLEHKELYDSQMEEKVAKKQNPFLWKNLKITATRDDSKKINFVNEPCIVIAGSGMLTGGRILKHLAHNISKEANMLVFCGYQAEGTLGRQISDGEKTVEIDTIKYDVKIKTSMIREFSAHADQLTLIKWLDGLYDKSANTKPTLFLMHGEIKAVEGYQKLVNDTLPNIQTYWPKFSERVKMW